MGFLLFQSACLFFEVFYHVTDGDKFTKIIVLDLDIEFLFASADQVSQLKRVDAEIIDKLCLKGDFSGFYVEVVDKNFFDTIKHNFISSNIYKI